MKSFEPEYIVDESGNYTARARILTDISVLKWTLASNKICAHLIATKFDMEMIMEHFEFRYSVIDELLKNGGK